jgi:DNA-binding response OmpR family regulator
MLVLSGWSVLSFRTLSAALPVLAITRRDVLVLALEPENPAPADTVRDVLDSAVGDLKAIVLCARPDDIVPVLHAGACDAVLRAVTRAELDQRIRIWAGIAHSEAAHQRSDAALARSYKLAIARVRELEADAPRARLPETRRRNAS